MPRSSSSRRKTTIITINKKSPASVSIHSRGEVVLHSRGGYLSKSLVVECFGKWTRSIIIFGALRPASWADIAFVFSNKKAKKNRIQTSVQNIYLRRSIWAACNFARIVRVPCYCPTEWCINDTRFIIQNYVSTGIRAVFHEGPKNNLIVRYKQISFVDRAV